MANGASNLSKPVRWIASLYASIASFALSFVVRSSLKTSVGVAPKAADTAGIATASENPSGTGNESHHAGLGTTGSVPHSVSLAGNVRSLNKETAMSVRQLL